MVNTFPIGKYLLSVNVFLGWGKGKGEGRRTARVHPGNPRGRSAITYLLLMVLLAWPAKMKLEKWAADSRKLFNEAWKPWSRATLL
jgi:hypothetical protein